MNLRARKFSKLLYFKDKRMTNLAIKVAETRSDKFRKDPDRHYPFNCTSKFYPLAHAQPRDIQIKFPLPCGFLYGESWGALRKCWIGYKAAHREEDDLRMREYATRIQTLQTQLGIPTASFPNLGILGDIFFLYDKEKENELRQKYMYENVVCDRFDVDNISQLVDEGKAEIFNNKLEYKRYKEREYYENFHNVFTEWSNSETTKEFHKANQRRWDYREKIKNELRQIQNELDSMPKLAKGSWNKVDKETLRKRRERKEHLQQQKVLKESEIASVTAVQLVRTDDGWKYVKEIIKDDYRRAKLYDYEPRYYLTDLGGHRLADYKEELDMGFDKNKDPYFYKLYLEDKEWEKIYSNTS